MWAEAIYRLRAADIQESYKQRRNNTMEVIITSQCENCQYGIVDDTDKSRIKVYCSAKDKTYCYGQCIQCDGYKKNIHIKEQKKEDMGR